MKHVSFVTPTELSYIDLISMGGSEKLGDESKLGQFCSGLKYAIALILRNSIEFKAVVRGNHFIGGHDRDVTTIFGTYTYLEVDELSGKEKELIGFTVSRDYESFNSLHCEDIFEAAGDENLQTGFSKELGYNWSPWMILRELYSNMLDEGGYYVEGVPPTIGKCGTVITLSFEENSIFDTIWENRHLYINESDDTLEVSYRVKAVLNTDKYLRIYKQNILVYEDKEMFSEYSYIINFGEIDERRILSDYSSVRHDILYDILSCENEEFIKGLFRPDFEEVKGAFLSRGGVYGTCSDTIHKLVQENVEKYDSFNTYEWLVNKAKDRKDCKLPGKKIQTVEDSLWSYSSTVVVESIPEEVKLSIKDNICKKYDLDLSEISVKESPLTGAKVVADKFNNCLILSPEFKIEDDIAEFIVEYYTLKQKGNIVKTLSTVLAQRLKK